MKGLQRNCLVASAFLHGLLLVVVIVGSAFVSHKPPEPAPAFEVFDAGAVLVNEMNVVTGGNPAAVTPPRPAPPVTPQEQQKPVIEEPKPPAKTPEIPREQPKPEPVRPEPIKPEPKSKPPDPDPFNWEKTITKTPQPKPEKPPTKFEFGNAVKKTIQPTKDAKESSEADDNARGAKDNRAAAARVSAVADAMKHLEGGLSATGTSIDIPGPGGAAFASYGLYLKKLYETAWIPPTAGRGDEPLVGVEVVIAKDGTILSSRIIKPSGRRELDNSINNALKRVRKARPLPEGTKDEKRLFKIDFNLLTEKLSVG
jgi:TonB family protein